MNRYVILSGACLASVLLLGNGQQRMPVTVVPSSFVEDFSQQGHGLLFQENGVSIMRRDEAVDADFNDLYVVRMPGKSAPPFFAERLGEVLHFEPGQFALMRIEELYKVETLSHLMHHEGIACGALMRLNGDVMVPDIPEGAGEPLVPVSEALSHVPTMVEKVSSERIRSMIQDLSTINTRFHSSTTGQQMPSILKAKYEELARGRDDVTVELFDHGGRTPQDSVVVRIRGTSRPDEIVVLGSHIDSVNWSDGSSSRSPGADDNASGTSTNFEIFRVLMESGARPERTIEIHGYAAEEIGLVGSQDMAQKYKAAGKNVVTMVQHDMNLYKAPGAPDKIWFVTNNTMDQFNSALGSLVDQYVGVQWGKKSLSGGDSDHTSWRRQGFVTSFPFEDPSGYNRQIHTSRDSLETASAMTQAAAFAKLGLAYLAHYAGI
jgi:bacterial leucyl aminopeptidase